MLKKIWNGAKELVRTAKTKVAVAVGAAAVVVSEVANAQIVLPDTGVDIAGHITAAIAAFGAVFAAAIGGMFAFKIVKKGARLISSALGG